MAEIKPASRLPWKVVPSTEDDEWGIARDMEPRGMSVAQMVWHVDARYIVHAANLYPVLLAALKALMENDEINLWVGGNPNVINGVVNRALDAIQQAEGPE